MFVGKNSNNFQVSRPRARGRLVNLFPESSLYVVAPTGAGEIGRASCSSCLQGRRAHGRGGDWLALDGGAVHKSVAPTGAGEIGFSRFSLALGLRRAHGRGGDWEPSHMTQKRALSRPRARGRLDRYE